MEPLKDEEKILEEILEKDMSYEQILARNAEPGGWGLTRLQLSAMISKCNDRRRKRNRKS